MTMRHPIVWESKPGRRRMTHFNVHGDLLPVQQLQFEELPIDLDDWHKTYVTGCICINCAWSFDDDGEALIYVAGYQSDGEAAAVQLVGGSLDRLIREHETFESELREHLDEIIEHCQHDWRDEHRLSKAQLGLKR